MKKIHILGLLAIAAAVAVLMSVAGDFSQYSDFSAAIEAPDRNHQIVGYLSLDKPVEYDPQQPNEFSFYMKDNNDLERQVRCLQEKPQDFERSEQIVLTGRMQGDIFVAHQIQLKCPSKYKERELEYNASQAQKAGAVD